MGENFRGSAFSKILNSLKSEKHLFLSLTKKRQLWKPSKVLSSTLLAQVSQCRMQDVEDRITKTFPTSIVVATICLFSDMTPFQ